ncbi:hypothetical protein Tco_1253835, partial [Tanacetum coccineum]
MEEFVRRYKLECRDVKGAPECINISGFMHGITNPELIKQLHDKIPKSVDEMMRTEAKLQEGRLLEPTKVRANAGHVNPPHKNTKRNSGFRQRKVQASSVNDNPGIKAKQWKRPGKGSKKGGNLRLGQTASNTDGTTMAEDSQTKITHTFSSESVISFPPLRGEDGMEGAMIIEPEMGGHFVGNKSSQ